jgi:hypothetical protein
LTPLGQAQRALLCESGAWHERAERLRPTQPFRTNPSLSLCLTITGRRPFVADGRAHPAHLQGRQGSTQRRRRAHRGPGAEPAVAAAGASIPRPRVGG